MNSAPWVRFALVICFFIFSVLTQVAFAQQGQNTIVICKLDKQVRTLRIQKNAENKNVLLYRKYTKDQDLGQFQFLKSALQVMREVQQNLENSNWECREVQQAKISDMTSEE